MKVTSSSSYDPETSTFNTKSVEAAVQDVLAINQQGVMVIKSTVPVGYTARLKAELGRGNIFSREFLRKALDRYENFYPSCIVPGSS